MRILLHAILLLFSINSFGQDLSKSLKYAFKKSDKDSLRSILTAWNLNIAPNEKNIEDKFEQAVYSIFNEFYTPFQPERLGSYKRDDSIYIDKLAIIQNKIKYAIAEFPDPDTIMLSIKKDTLSLSECEQVFGKDNITYQLYEELKYPKIKTEDEKEILDFRPETMLPNERRLYLASPYKKELIKFLGNQHASLGFGGLMNPARATKKTFRRQTFLNNYITVIYGHWGGYWHLETHPEISLVIINPSLTRAFLFFRLGYSGGDAILEKRNGDWKLIESRLTWME